MRKENISFLGGLTAAGVGSVCCVGPTVLAGLGLGAGAVSFIRDIGFLHWPLLALAGLLFGWSYYLRCRRKSGSGAGAATCEVVPGSLRKE
ncbi:MAG: hypothetical protein ACE5G9_01060 [Nitrospinales bacterium]